MKTRLLVGVVTCAVMLAILAGVTTPAKADNPGGLTCGGSVVSGTAFYSLGGGWHVGDDHNCNLGKTYSVELQYNTPQHPLTWTDYSRDYTRSSGSCSSGCNVNYVLSDVNCPTAGAVYQLRFKWWWSDGSISTTPRTAVVVCDGGLLSTP